jgi:hypothetical protein
MAMNHFELQTVNTAVKIVSGIALRSTPDTILTDSVPRGYTGDHVEEKLVRKRG